MYKPPVEVEKVSSDVIVVGGGGAASRAALSARQAGASVRLVTKAAFKAGGSTVHGASEMMGMGAVGYGDKSDRPEFHFEDTMRAAKGFIDPVLVRVLSEEAPDRVRDLMQLGVAFDKRGEDYRPIRSDFGSYARALTVSGKTGKAFVDAISDELLRQGVKVDAGVALVDLIRDQDGEIAGVVGYDAKRRTLIHYEAPSVILGTGGVHSAFQLQVSTAEMTGDGQAICFRHGAELVNLEFHQIGPTLIYPYVQLFSSNAFCLAPKMYNVDGEEFLQRYLPPGLDPQKIYDEKAFPFTTANDGRYIDIAMSREINGARGTAHGAVLFSFAHLPPGKFESTMPHTVRWLRQHDLDPMRDKLEVGVAFQCMNGGVRMMDIDAQSNVPGLFVIGELAGGVRGPDRPGGNSLAEGQVFGHRAGVAAARRARATKAGNAHSLDGTREFLFAALTRKTGASDLSQMNAAIQSTMQKNCLVEKTAVGLESALDTVRAVKLELDSNLSVTTDSLVDGLSTRNLAQSSELILQACLHRKESRSGHYRVDHPERDDKGYLHSIVIQRKGEENAFSELHY